MKLIEFAIIAVLVLSVAPIDGRSKSKSSGRQDGETAKLERSCGEPCGASNIECKAPCECIDGLCRKGDMFASAEEGGDRDSKEQGDDNQGSEGGEGSDGAPPSDGDVDERGDSNEVGEERRKRGGRQESENGWHKISRACGEPCGGSNIACQGECECIDGLCRKGDMFASSQAAENEDEEEERNKSGEGEGEEGNEDKAAGGGGDEDPK